MIAARNLVDVSELARMLDARAHAVVREILPDGERRGHEWVARCPWRADRHLGSFSVHLSGAKAGLWCDFVTKESGDLLDLVTRTLFGGDKARGILWAKRYLGLDTGDANAIERVRQATPTAQQIAAEETREAHDRRQLAFRLWLAGTADLLGTPLDLYLRGRGVPLAELGHIPRAIHFHPALYNTESQRKWPAMIAHVAGPDGAFVSAHRTWLEVLADGRVRKAPIAENKMTLGTWRGGCIRLWKGKDRPEFKKMRPGEIVDVTEGIEDALSVAYACPDHRVLVGINVGGMGGLTLPDAVAGVRLWRQNDKKPAAIAAFETAKQVHLDAGREVLVPDVPPHLKDVNDLLCEEQA